MNSAEARDILARELVPYRERSYEQLCGLVGAPTGTFEVTGPTGAWYQVVVAAHWDGEPYGDVRVIGCIDDGGLRAFVPLTDSFIKAADGSFVGEESN